MVDNQFAQQIFGSNKLILIPETFVKLSFWPSPHVCFENIKKYFLCMIENETDMAKSKFTKSNSQSDSSRT